MPRWKKKAAWVLVFLGLGSAGFLVWKGRIGPEANPDPRLTYLTPYRNVRPDVAYVGDERCAACHQNKVTTYRQHPMGQSLSAVAEARAFEHFEQTPDNPFDAMGFRYQALRREKNVIHQESRQSEQGKNLYTHEAEVLFRIGSGARGGSYLIGRDGYLFQSPISWFSQAAKWDLSPGYRHHNHHFERPIIVDCLFCHANQVEAVPHTLNRYRQPIFKGQAIGCERCHGPGELHVRRQENGDAGGDLEDIVNPGRLAPPLRDAVCEQCHLQGEARVPLRRRQFSEYRPGLPLHLFVAAFVRPAEFSDNFRSVGQVEQMTSSRCYQKSAGKLGCISCHDPHRLPPADNHTKVAYYRKRCQACHEPDGKDCVFPLAERQKSKDNCLSCHMEHLQSSNIAHTANTDHRILRRPSAAVKQKPRFLRPEEVPLVHFHGHLLEPGESAERELGIALAQLALDQGKAEPALLALARLKKSLQQWPADQPALKAQGISLALLRRTNNALEAFETLLQSVPEHEEALSWAASLAQQLGRQEKAISYWQRAIAVNPYMSQYQYALGYLHFQGKDWKAALAAGQKTLELNPASLDARKLLIQSFLRLGDRKRAKEEFAVFQGFQPPDLAIVKGWFDKP